MTDVTRRAVVLGLAVAAGYAVVPGAVTRAMAQRNPKRRLYAQILNEAIASRDMQAAIGRQRKFLSQQEMDVFMSLTPDELGTLRNFRARMQKMGVLQPMQ
jgi:hypothetical protein